MKPHVVKGRAAGALHLGPAVELADVRRECGAGVLRLPVQDRFRDDRLDDRPGWRGSGGGGGGGGGGGPGGRERKRLEFRPGYISYCVFFFLKKKKSRP